MSNSVYKTGQWLKELRSGDLYEITRIYNGPSYLHIVISKKFDSMSNSHYGSIFNRTMDFKDLRDKFELAPMAQVLLQYSNNK
jgi:hypothetical protein